MLGIIERVTAIADPQEERALEKNIPEGRLSIPVSKCGDKLVFCEGCNTHVRMSFEDVF